MLIHLLENFAATPSDVDAEAIKLYINENFQALTSLNPERSAEMNRILLKINQLLEEDFDSIKIYRIIDYIRFF